MKFFGNFLENFFGGMFFEEFFGRILVRRNIFGKKIFCGEFFWEELLGGIFWEDFSERNSLFALLKLFEYEGIDLFVKILSQGKILTNKFGLFARILVCLSKFWFVCQHFGLFASILVCLPALWFVCKHFG